MLDKEKKPLFIQYPETSLVEFHDLPTAGLPPARSCLAWEAGWSRADEPGGREAIQQGQHPVSARSLHQTLIQDTRFFASRPPVNNRFLLLGSFHGYRQVLPSLPPLFWQVSVLYPQT